MSDTVNEAVGSEALDPATVTEPEAEQLELEKKMDLRVQVESVGPCKKHVRVGIPRHEIDELTDTLVQEYSDKVQVPGFRVGHVPADLVRKRYKKELGEEAKQRLLMQSLEQIGKEESLQPIGEPNLDLDSIEVPDEGDFEYEFDIEVRPEFELPDYKSFKIRRPVREVTDEDVEAYIERFVDQYGKQVPVDAPAQPGDFVSVDIELLHNGELLQRIEDVSVRVLPKLRLQDAEIQGFDKLIAGAAAGEVREADLTVSMEAPSIPLRGETVHARFTILDVKRLERPQINEEFLERVGAESVEDLKRQVRRMLERQVRYEQRQSCRRQVIEQIVESADWDLPEDLRHRQTENALRREILEMQQAGFTTREIMARENELRQRSLTMTRQNLKEHFVLDQIAETEKIEVTPEDVEYEITVMAIQSGENPRRVRARLVKSGMIDNLMAQIRERKAVDFVLDHAQFEDVPLPPPTELDVEALDRSVCPATSQPAADTVEEDEA